MAGPKDFTGQNIQDTYQRVLQTDGVNIFDGTGSAFSLTSAVSITASHALFAISASHEITHELSTSYSQTADSASDDFHIANNLHFTGLTSEITSNGATQFTFQPTNGQILAASNIRTQDGKGIKFGVDSDYTIQHNSTGTGDTKLAIREGNTTRWTYGIGGHLTGSSNVNLWLSNGGEFIGNSANITNITASKNDFTGLGGNISASGFIQTNTLKGGGDEVSLNVLGSITASGDISSSGKLYGTDLYLGNKEFADYHGPSDTFRVAATGEPVHIFANVTASGNISASKAIIGDSINVLNGSAATGYKLYQPGPAGTLQLSAADGTGFATFYVKADTTEVQSLNVGGNTAIGTSLSLGQPSTDTITINSIINNNITSSGNISSSGYGQFANLQVPAGGYLRFDDVIGSDDQYIIGNENNITVDGDAKVKLIANDVIEVGIATNDIKLTIDTSEGHITTAGDISASGNIFTSGHISASGDISSSGVLYVNHISTGSGELAENYISITGSTSVFGNITASGNINIGGDLYLPVGGKVRGPDGAEFLQLNGVQAIIYAGNKSMFSGVSSTGVTINDGGYAEIDFRVESDNDTHAFFVDAGEDKVAIGTNTVSDSLLTVDGDITAAGDISSSGVLYINHISTGSGELAENYISITGSTSVFGNITASGNISASGDLTVQDIYVDQGKKIYLDGDDVSTPNTYIYKNSNALDIQVLGQQKIQIGNTTTALLNNEVAIGSAAGPQSLTVHGNTTTTDLSASGVVYTNHISTGSGELVENYISITGSTSVFGNITASANISASGHIITHTLRGNTSGDQSGSLTLGGSLTFNENVAEPAVSASTLFAKRSGSNNATDSDLRFSNSGLTPSFGFFSMDGNGTDDSNENPFGKGGGSVTSTTHNMIHTFVDGSEGVRAYIQLGGIYKIHGALICESSAVIAEVEISIRKDGSDVFATRMEVHSSVDPVERSFLGVTTAESGSYFDVTLGTPTSTGNINMKAGSTLMIERLA
tara:strand:- start:16527 stop:19532 length:3006 start_codon:yes stop_codon:yes gene_type:complete